MESKFKSLFFSVFALIILAPLFFFISVILEYNILCDFGEGCKGSMIPPFFISIILLAIVLFFSIKKFFPREYVSIDATALFFIFLTVIILGGLYWGLLLIVFMLAWSSLWSTLVLSILMIPLVAFIITKIIIKPEVK